MGLRNTATDARMMTTRFTVFATECERGELAEGLVRGLVVQVVEHGARDEVGEETRLETEERDALLRHSAGAFANAADICDPSMMRDRGSCMMPETIAIPP